MPILIDGHNLIGQMHTISLADPDDEAQLVMLLRRYATKKRGRKVIVIFDGGVYGHPDNLNGYGVEARFAKSPSDADSELIRRIRMVRRRDEWQVVSSDNAVIGVARDHGIPIVSSQEFARRLEALNAPTSSAPAHEKRNERSLSNAEIAEWLRLFGVTGDEEQN